MLIFNVQLTLSDLISCTTVEGTLSATGDDDLSEVTCPADMPTMVSCGYYSEGGARDGGYISDNKCYAQNGGGGNGVKAYARCCSIFSGAECVDEQVELINPRDDTKANAECPSDYTLTGCTVNTNWNAFDGILPVEGVEGNNYCELQSSDETVFGYARCCKPADTAAALKCNIVSATSTGSTGSVTCESGIMTGCSAVEVWDNLNRWYIEDDTCYAERKSTANDKGWTISGICCEVLDTPAPTPYPTLDGCDFDIERYLEECYCIDNVDSAMTMKSPFDRYGNNGQNYYEPQGKYTYDYNPMQAVNNSNDDLILKILCMNSLAIMVIFGYLVYVNGCSRRKESGYGKVYDTEYDSEVRAMKA